MVMKIQEENSELVLLPASRRQHQNDDVSIFIFLEFFALPIFRIHVGIPIQRPSTFRRILQKFYSWDSRNQPVL